MLTKLRGMFGDSSASTGMPSIKQYSTEKVSSFYSALSREVRSLEVLLISDPSRFRLEWMQTAVEFFRHTHARLLSVLEDALDSNRSSVKIAMVNRYYDVSTRLLDMCSFLKIGLNHLEYCQMYMDYAVIRLSSAVERIPFAHRPDDSTFANLLLECQKELDRLDFKEHPSLWNDFVSKRESLRNVKHGTSLRRAMTVFPSTSEIMAEEASNLMFDVHVVTNFFAAILVWVVTGSTLNDQLNVNLNIPSEDQTNSGWLSSLLRLKKRFEITGLGLTGPSSRLPLQDMQDVHDAIRKLSEKLAVGMTDGAIVPGSDLDRYGEVHGMLEQLRKKLNKVKEILDILSSHTSALFSEIIASRRRLLEIVEGRNEMVRTLSM